MAQSSDRRAAVPAYVGTDFRRCPPGHRFGLYFHLWNDRWRRAGDEAKRKALADVLAMDKDTVNLLDALRARQAALAEQAGDTAITFAATSTAPFMTGLGIEHPLENGFSFLSPYGLPYLPGSGVKGVVRRAAETLVLEPDPAARLGWTMVAVWWLFGFEAGARYLRGPADGDPDAVADIATEQRDAYLAAIDNGDLDSEALACFITATKTHRQYEGDAAGFLRALTGAANEGVDRRAIHFKGALSFWDCFPKPKNDRLGVDILTPHLGKYYEGKEPPHGAGQPTPNPFLVLPEDADFRFYVACEPRLPAGLQGRWRGLVAVAFDHAFDMLGFGAKTAVGYGQLERDRAAAPVAPVVVADKGTEWLGATVSRLKAKLNQSEANILRGKPLAQAWDELEDLDIKSAARRALEHRWASVAGARPRNKQVKKIYGDIS